MKKFLHSLRVLFKKQSPFLSALLLFMVMMGFAGSSQAQVYYVTNDGNGTASSSADAVAKMNYDGTSSTNLISSFTNSPGWIAIDPANNRAFVYESYTTAPTKLPNNLAIKVINLNNGTVTTTISIPVPSRVTALKYDPINDYIYFIAQDDFPTTTSANDVFMRVKPDGSGMTTLMSGFCKNPQLLSLDIPNNRAYIMENLAVDRSFLTVNLSTNTVIQTAQIIVPVGTGMTGIDCEYDPVTNYIYWLSSDGQNAQNTNDGIFRIHPDGTSQATVSGAIGARPYCGAFDFGHNEAYFYDNSTARDIYSINLTSGAEAAVKSISALTANALVTGIAVPSRPIVTTSAATGVTATSVVLAGILVHSDLTTTDHGLVYSTTNTVPALGTDTKLSLAGLSGFSATASSLSPVATYYVRAYAVSAAGTSYGAVTSFTTVSNDDNLSALTISTGTLSPAFAAATTGYSVNVSYTVSSMAVTPTREQANATITVDNNPVASGSASGAINLNTGNNNIPIEVTAQDGSVKQYLINVIRAQSPQTITLNPIATQTYGAADFNASGSASSTLPLYYQSDNSAVATISTTGTVHIVGAGTANIIASQAGNTNYLAATSVSQPLTVSKAVLAYTADTTSRAYGAADPTYLGAVNGFVNGDTQASATTGTLTFATTATSTSDVGTYPIIGSGLNAANYTFTQTQANSKALTINKITITYTALPFTRVYGAANPQFNVVFTGLANNQTIDEVAFSFSYNTPAVATSPAGSYPINVSGLSATNYNFAAAPSNTTALTITPGSLTFTAAAATRAYGAANPALSGTLTGFVNNETIASLGGTPVYSTTATQTSGIGSYPITLSGVTTNNYTITAAPANNTAFTVTQAALTYVANPVAREYNTANPSVSGMVTGFLNGDTQSSATTGTLSFSTAVTPATAVGTYPITGSGLSSANYSFVQSAANSTAFSIFLSTNGNLSSLSISQGTLSPAFSAGTNSYTATVATGITSLTVTPTLSDNNAAVTVAGSNVASGTASANVPLSVGPNNIPVNVTAQDGTTSNPYNITVTRLPSSDATLSSVSISPGSLVSSGYAYAYYANVDNTTTSVALTAVVNEPNATLSINNVPQASGSAVTLPLLVGNNVSNVAVTAQDGTTLLDYNITIIRAASSNNLLTGLTVSTGTLSPAFATGTNSYTLQLPNSTSSVDFTPVTADATANVAVNGNGVLSGTAITEPLTVGDNPMTVTVIAQNGTQNNYNVDVTRAVSTDATLSSLGITTTGTIDQPFSSGNTLYNYSVGSNITSFNLNPVANNSGSTITVNGSPLNTYSGYTMQLIYFTVNEPVVIVVTAGDGVTQQTYTVNVNRQFSSNALLSGLTIYNGVQLSPNFDSGTNNYTATISDPTVTSLAFAPQAADSKATITVGGQTVTSGSATFAQLQGGINVITINVEAQDGTQNNYTITLTRAYSSNANLAYLTASGSNFSQTFTVGQDSLTANVPNSVASLRLLPTAADAGGTVITVNGYLVSGGETNSLPLVVGDNVFTISVTAADNSNTISYTFHAIRLPFTDITLSSLSVGSAVLTPAFASGTTSYTALVGSSDTSILVTPVADSPSVSVNVNGDTIKVSHPTSTVTPIYNGERLSVQVVAPDGVNKQTYSVRINIPAPNANLSNILLSQGTVSPAFTTANTTYTATVGYSASSISFTPTTPESTATITVSSGGTNTTISTANPSATIPLVVGSNTITTVITASDNSSTKTYTVTVTRSQPSTDATLAGISLSSGTLSPSFSAGNNAYTAEVPNTTSTINVSPATTNANATTQVNGTPVTVGSGYAASLSVGVNTITTIVTAQDGATTATYTINVTRDAPAANAALASLTLDAGALSPIFNSSTFTYTASVNSTVSSVTLSPVTADPNATILVNGTAPDPELGTITIPLNAGANIITTVVTAQNGTTTATYTTTISKGGSISTLSNLTVSSGALSPGFNSGTNNYTATVAGTVASVTLTPTATDASATITINGSVVASGSASAAIPLVLGYNTITASTRSGDGTSSSSYTLTILRQTSSNATLNTINPNTTSLLVLKTSSAILVNYTTSVDFNATSIAFTPIPMDPDATVTVNNTPVANGTLSQLIPLNATGTTLITAVVTAQDGTTIRTYKITVSKLGSNDPYLSSLKLSAPSVLVTASTTPTLVNYTTTVDASTTSVTVTPTSQDAHATITVNGIPVTSGTASGAIALNGIGSPTVITTVVSAQDGVTQKTYVVTISRTGSNDPLLNSISMNPVGIMNTATSGPASVNYTTSVDPGISTVTLTPNAQDPNSTITINGSINTTSGVASAPIALNGTGSTTISLLVTAADGITTKTYSVTISPTGSNNALLTSLKLSGTSTVVTASSTTAQVSYTTSVNGNTTGLTLTPTASDVDAIIKMNGSVVNSGTAVPVTLNATGSTTITTIVTAPDGSTTKTYLMTISKTGSNNPILASLKLNPIATLTTVSATPTLVNYTAAVTNSVASITVTPTAQDPGATITVNGTPVNSGTASGSVALTTGPNAITTVVTAGDGVTQKTYVITVTRAYSANANLISLLTSPSSTLTTLAGSGTSVNYSCSVALSTALLSVIPTVQDTTATVSVNGAAVASGTASGTISLQNAGTPTNIAVVVTARNGTQKIYNLQVNRTGSSDAALSSLKLNTPSVFTTTSSTATLVQYTTTVDPGTTTVEVTPVTHDPNASVTVNGISVISGSASDPVTLNATGTTLITTVVTAQNGTQRTYDLMVSPSGSNDPILASLKLSPSVILTTVTATTTATLVNYTASVSAATASVTVTPTAQDPDATITVNTATVASGSASGVILLATGTNTITTVVTASDGISQKTYVITLTRDAPIVALTGNRATDSLAMDSTNTASPLGDHLANLITADNVVVHQAVSPNGDGINDYLKIEGIEAYPNNKLVIVSNSGDKVFEASGYNNNTRVYDGHSSINGSMNRAGTYFYMLNYSVNGTMKSKSGYFVLKY